MNTDKAPRGVLACKKVRGQIIMILPGLRRDTLCGTMLNEKAGQRTKYIT